MNKTIQIAANLLDAGTADDTVKKLMGIDTKLLNKAKVIASKNKSLTLEQFKKVIDQVKKKYVFFPEYTLAHKDTQNCYRLVTSNTKEVLEDVFRHTGGDFTIEGLFVHIKTE